MSTTIKYKLSEVSADLGMDAKDISDIVGLKFEKPKSGTALLTVEQLNLVFDVLTLKNQTPKLEQLVKDNILKNLMENMDKEARQQEEKKAEAKKVHAAQVQKSASQPANAVKKEQPAQARPAGTQENRPAYAGQKPQQFAPRPQQQFNAGQTQSSGQRPQQNNNAGQTQNAGQKPQQFAPRPQQQFNAGQTQSSGQRPQQNNNAGQTQNAGQNPQQTYRSPQQQNSGQRPQQTYSGGQSQGAGQRPQQTYGNRPTGSGPARPVQQQYGSQTQPRFTTAPKMPSDIKPFEHQQKEKRGPQVKASDITTRVVDTRLTEVNLAKYDEKLEQFLPYTAKQDSKVVTKSKIRRVPVSLKTKGRSRNDVEFLKKIDAMNKKKSQLIIKIPDEISVGDLAAMLKVTSTQVIKKLMTLGVMASVSELIDFDTAGLLAIEFGAKVEHAVTVTIEEQLIDESTDTKENLIPRSPVVVVMGHVDHGKTSLLDAIRHENVVAGEAGGITQHIGAYKIKIKNREITFLDTPGHEAFTAMRARGAQITDIAILVVAADDGIMPQTIEAINHAKQAGVAIIVAVNKMDKPEANLERVKQELTEYGLVAEEWGGDTIICPVSAVKKTGIDNLLEMIILTADMRELKANPNRFAKGTVIEARLDKGRGPIATLLVQNGTLKTGNVIIAGTCVGRIRLMTDDKGNRIEEAGPSTPVEITGLSEVPNAGDIFHAVEDEKMARELAEQRKNAVKNEEFSKHKAVSLEDLFSQIKAGEIKDLNIIVKADVQGSAEALRSSLEKLSNEEVHVQVIHSGVGAITKGDVTFASASNAIIVGFNVRPDPVTRSSAEDMGVDIRTYRIIYEAIEEMEQAMKGLLAPIFKESTLGHAEVRQIFKVPGIGVVSGCYVQEGKIARNAQVRVVRDGIVIHEGKIDSLKRFKDDAKEVSSGFECGIGLEKFNDLKEGDIIEAFIMEQIAR